MAREQLAVVAVQQLAGDERPDIGLEVDQAGPGEQGGDRGGRQHLALRRVALYRRGHLGTVGHTAARPEMQAGLAPRGDVPQGAVVGDEPAAAALREQHDEVDRGQSHPPHDDVVAGAELREIGIGGEGGRHVLQPVTARRGDEVGGGGIRFPACVTERVHDRVGVELEPRRRARRCAGHRVSNRAARPSRCRRATAL
ncbi:MAG: hypothetical protein PGN24_02160 [Microbacterium arborescens]